MLSGVSSSASRGSRPPLQEQEKPCATAGVNICGVAGGVASVGCCCCQRWDGFGFGSDCLVGHPQRVAVLRSECQRQTTTAVRLSSAPRSKQRCFNSAQAAARSS